MALSCLSRRVTNLKCGAPCIRSYKCFSSLACSPVNLTPFFSFLDPRLMFSRASEVHRWTCYKKFYIKDRNYGEYNSLSVDYIRGRLNFNMFELMFLLKEGLDEDG